MGLCGLMVKTPARKQETLDLISSGASSFQDASYINWL
jgi:hypothetical protein